MPNKTENRLGTEIILQEQNNSFAENLPDLHEIKKMCAPFVNAIKTSDVRRINKILSLYWVIKQKISPDKINFETQRIIEQYVNLGCGVKICGAGQGGYIFIFDNNRRCDAIAVKIDYLGTILLDNNKET
jgi:galactokinase/mevalonate kinase-like predicted kinase